MGAHNAGFGPVGRYGFSPSLVTHGTNYSFARRRHFLGLEHLLIQGVPCVPAFAKASGSTCGFQHLIDSGAINSKMKRLAGNAIHVPLLGRQVSYIISRVVKRPRLERPLALPDLLADGSSAEQDEAASNSCTEPALAKRPRFVKMPSFEFW